MSTRHIQDRHDGYAISKHGPGSNRTYGCCISSEVELLTATDTATPTGRKRDATDLENTQSPPKKKKVCDRCGRRPRERVTCVGGCMRRVGPGCGQENVYLRCLLLEFPRLASRRSPHCRTGICVDCISQNPGGVMSSMRYTSSGAQSTGTLL